MSATDQSPLDQALDELTIESRSPFGALSDIADWPTIRTIAAAAAAVIEEQDPPNPRAAAMAAALYGMGIGVRAERIRQRRHGEHPDEIAPGAGT